MATGFQRETGYTYDTLLALQATAVTDTASAEGASVVDLGATGAGGNEDSESIVRGDVIIDISALAIDGNDEVYTFTLVGSDTDDFSSGSEVLQELRVGALEVLTSGDNDPNDVDSDAGRYILPFVNLRNTRVYRYVRLDLTVAGATSSITWAAFIGKRK